MDPRGLLTELGLDTLAGVFARPGEVRGRFKSLVRVEHGGARLFVKRYEFPRAEVWLRGALKGNPPVFSGPRERDNLLALAEAGFRVPQPLGAGDADLGGTRRSYVVLSALSGAPLSDSFAAQPPAGRRRIVRELGTLARRLHAAGFWHRDLYLDNVFAPPADEPELGLGLLDCERVGRRAGGPALRWRIKDLAALAYSADLSRPELTRLLGAYFDVRRLTGAQRRCLPLVARKARRLRRHGLKSASVS